MTNGTRTEEFHVNGDEILKKVREIFDAGNARRIIIRTEQDHTQIGRASCRERV